MPLARLAWIKLQYFSRNQILMVLKELKRVALRLKRLDRASNKLDANLLDAKRIVCIVEIIPKFIASDSSPLAS